MNRYTFAAITILLVALSITGANAAAAAPTLRLATVFSDHMVLQRDAKAPVWGWGQAGDTLTVTFAGQQKTAVAGTDGKWKVILNPLKVSSQPAALTVTSARGDKSLEITDVLVGDVWLCGGQSNMDFGLGGAEHGAQEIAAANFPRLRFFSAVHTLADAPAQEVRGQWYVCSPQTAGNAYAAAYFFARELQRTQDVPIGLLQAAWSGMPAEAAVSREMLDADPALRPILKRCFTDKAAYEAAKKAYDAHVPAWQAARTPADTGNAGEKLGWAAPAAELNGWGTANLPMLFMHGDPALYLQGAVWFRREVEIPAEWAGHPLTLALGPIADFDTTYLDGKKIGATDADSPDTAKISRAYTIPAELAVAGKHTLAVRMFTRYNEPGFAAKPAAMCLLRADATDAPPIPLDGPWRYRVERVCDFIPFPCAPYPPDSCFAPTKVYNGMIAPLATYGIRGVLWYQGEHNGEHAAQYARLLPALITSWRKQWGQGDFPFLYVQLPNWLYHQEVPSGCPWAELRDVQRRTLALPNTGMAVTIDLGEAASIHPIRKQEVGRRLALVAEKLVYGLDIPYSGPLYRAMRVNGKRLRVDFTCAFGGLKADGPTLTGFTIAGADRHFVPAQATIDGDAVWVSSDEVTKPVAVRYAWVCNPRCNLRNAAGLPASPFRTDDWLFLLSLEETEPNL